VRTSRKDSVLTPGLDPVGKRHGKYGTLARCADDAIMSFHNTVDGKRFWLLPPIVTRERASSSLSPTGFNR
jgi:hypothetical protein